ncbi:MAG TPA: NAD kinase [Candidatus Megaira endosymbiont of Hartmannula sinica]|nr:NAD kinase [Candidatus Megaera endosymbiont of Hartmannula sinica]
MIYKNIIIYCNKDCCCQETINILRKYFIITDNPNEADLIIVLGGDGSMIHAIDTYKKYNIPFYGINFGTVGFLLNNCDKKNIISNITKSDVVSLPFLSMEVTNGDGDIFRYEAVNEVSIFRSSNQASKLNIYINGINVMNNLTGDGIVTASPAGSSAYNLSAGGMILPISSNIISLTPICPFRPRRWRGALLDFNANIKIIVNDNVNRPVNAVADFHQVKNAKIVNIKINQDKQVRLLFDSHHSAYDRNIKEQFSF